MNALVAIARGDATKDGSITTSDITLVNNYIFKGGPLDPPALGDANCSGSVTAADVIYLVGYVFKGGPAPFICFQYDY